MRTRLLSSIPLGQRSHCPIARERCGADTGRIRRRGTRPMPPALSADPISPSTIERPLRPPQRSLTREDTGVHCFSFESLIVYRSSAPFASIFSRPAAGSWYGQTPRLPDARRRRSAARLRGLRDRRPCGRSRPPSRRGPTWSLAFFFLRGGGRRRRRRLRASTSFESSLIPP